MSGYGTKIAKIIPIIIGIVFIVLGTAFYIGFKPEAYDAKAVGKITGIEEYYDSVAGDNELMHTVYVDFTAGDKKYANVELKEYNSFMKVGDDIEIYYMTSDPTKIVGEGKDHAPFFGLGFAMIGAAIIAVTVIRIIRGRKRTEAPD